MKKPEIVALLRQAVATSQRAHAPYSKFHVGAALLADDGSVVTGCNVENASYGLTICAERNAIFHAVATGRTKFKAVAVVADGEAIPYPCGACRQVLAEFAPKDAPLNIYLVSDEGVETHTLDELLPNAFKL